jgi:protocatechuate 3,4-dioxygenase, beta subunit
MHTTCRGSAVKAVTPRQHALIPVRAPHIHFEVFGTTNRPVTQMYFAGEALNDTDRFLATAAGNRERLIVPFRGSSESQANGSLVGVWDIVLDQG